MRITCVALCSIGMWAITWSYAQAAPTAVQPQTQELATSSNDQPSQTPSASSNKLQFLPASISEGLDVNLWGWLGYGLQKSDERSSYWDGQLQLDITKSFSERLAVSADVNFIDANDHMFGQLEQMFATMLLSDNCGTLLTVGKIQRIIWGRAAGLLESHWRHDELAIRCSAAGSGRHYADSAHRANGAEGAAISCQSVRRSF